MKSITTTAQAVRAVDDRRRQIESMVLADLELALLVDPAPAGVLITDVSEPSLVAAGTENASAFRVVTWQA